MTTDPDWWRGQKPPHTVPVEWGWGNDGWITGRQEGALDGVHALESGQRRIAYFRAEVRDMELWLNDVHLAVTWSEFDNCHFRQRVRPVLNEYGVAAQGSFGNRPSIYRNCTFERIRFKGLGGFSMMSARFEDCTFVNCRWEGHFAHNADLLSCTFIGRMNGCVWFGQDVGPGNTERRNVIRGNDFTQTQFTDNVAWRFGFPISDQHWPPGFVPCIDVP